MKPRKRIRPVSVKQRMKLGLYAIQKKRFMQAHQWCQCCMERGLTPKKAEELHHVRGRVGTLLLDERYWRCACRPCHRFIHDNIAEARKLGLIAEAGKWNNPRE